MSQWARTGAVDELRRELHWYLARAAVRADAPVVVDELLRLPSGFRRRTLAAQLLTSDATQEALHAIEVHLPQVAPGAKRQFAETRGVVSGPVEWGRTAQRRLAVGDPLVFVARPALRDYDTARTRLIAYCLSRIVALGIAADIGGPHGIGAVANEVVDRARLLRTHKKLRLTRLVSRLDPLTMSAVVERVPALRPCYDAATAADEVLAGGSPTRLVDGILGGLFVPDSDATLFELWVGFRMIRAFEAAGASVSPFVIEPDGDAPAFARVEIAARHITMYYQRSAWSLPCVGGTGRFATAASAGGLSTSALRPDFVLVDDATPPNLFLVEAKHTAKGVAIDRDGIRDCLAYLHDLETAEGIGHRRCLVVASNSTGTPAQTEVSVSGPDQIAAAATTLIE